MSTIRHVWSRVSRTDAAILRPSPDQRGSEGHCRFNCAITRGCPPSTLTVRMESRHRRRIHMRLVFRRAISPAPVRIHRRACAFVSRLFLPVVRSRIATLPVLVDFQSMNVRNLPSATACLRHSLHRPPKSAVRRRACRFQQAWRRALSDGFALRPAPAADRHTP